MGASRSIRAVAALALAAVCCAPAGAAARVEAPLVRIGLAIDAEAATIATSAGPLLVAPLGRDGSPGPFRTVPSPLRLGVRADAQPGSPERWYVDLAAGDDRARAERLASGLAEALSVRLRVGRVGERYRVSAGPFEAVGDARAVAERLEAAGVGETALREQPARRAISRLGALGPGFALVDLPGDRVAFRAADPDEHATLDGAAHRGVLEAFVSEADALNVVVALGLEDYLRGVVPEELGPATFPAPEALKAQAIAARTYAVDQLDSRRHAGEGYDLCPTAHCQVYGGVEAEHEESDAAVAVTAGRVVTWEGRPARTFFSSTCGGVTEAVETVFPEHEPTPYLRSVACEPERVTFVELRGEPPRQGLRLVDGRSAELVIARLAAHGLFGGSEPSASDLAAPVDAGDVIAWTRATASRVGWPLTGAAEVPHVRTAIGFLRWLERSLGWSSRRSFVRGVDLAAASRFADLEGLDGDDLLVALLARKEGMLPAGLEPGWARSRPTAAFALEVLDGWLAAAEAHETPAERVLSAGPDGHLVLLAGTERRRVSLPPDVRLFSGPRGGPWRARESVSVKLADVVRAWPAGDAQPRVLAVVEDPDGAAFDRTSSFSWWRRRIPFDEVARAARRHGVESLSDLEVERRGSSRRIAALRLRDADGSETLVRGFAARGVLGLPDLLAELTIERDEAGRPRTLVAVGRGWGHGVGLCQFGAYGMALAGRSAEEILAHYYPGTGLAALSSLP